MQSCNVHGLSNRGCYPKDMGGVPSCVAVSCMFTAKLFDQHQSNHNYLNL